jgi:hypothetical protein
VFPCVVSLCLPCALAASRSSVTHTTILFPARIHDHEFPGRAGPPRAALQGRCSPRVFLNPASLFLARGGVVHPLRTKQHPSWVSEHFLPPCFQLLLHHTLMLLAKNKDKALRSCIQHGHWVPFGFGASSYRVCGVPAIGLPSFSSSLCFRNAYSFQWFGADWVGTGLVATALVEFLIGC